MKALYFGIHAIGVSVLLRVKVRNGTMLCSALLEAKCHPTVVKGFTYVHFFTGSTVDLQAEQQTKM